ncbi:MAG: hypothetical protein ACOX8W_04655 [bacterium]
MERWDSKTETPGGDGRAALLPLTDCRRPGKRTYRICGYDWARLDDSLSRARINIFIGWETSIAVMTDFLVNGDFKAFVRAKAMSACQLSLLGRCLARCRAAFGLEGFGGIPGLLFASVDAEDVVLAAHGTTPYEQDILFFPVGPFLAGMMAAKHGIGRN